MVSPSQSSHVELLLHNIMYKFNLEVVLSSTVFIEFPPGHPYVDIIDNKMDFESKINRLISCVAAKMGIDIGDRLNVNAKKVKFAVTGPLPKDSAFPNFRDFEVRKDPIVKTNSS